MERNLEVRPYEISLWTLQDSFITVLKWGNFDQKGQVQDAILIQDVDGTQELTFTIPMYLSNPDELGNNKKIENPIWYNTRNGNLMVNLRKIKVIINKEDIRNREIYEFIINKITERHEKGQLYCDVSCEGLAFNELGKIGYKISLSSDDFYNDYEDWFKSSNSSFKPEPRQTIQYWNNKFLKPYPNNKNEIIPNQWYYQIQMNYGPFANSASKLSSRVYEEEHVSSWDLTYNNTLTPKSISELKEKERPIDIEESNIYNITQKIAEIFGVFCKYEYEYDDNFHIIARKVVYYNNFIEENNGHMDITYPYHTSKIIREADGTDIVTKMFVRIQDEGTDIPLTIMNADANKSKEDYILNFDYLYELGIINKEQYDEIDIYERKMCSLNKDLNKLNKQIDIISNKKLQEDTNQSMAQKEISAATQQLNNSINHLNNLGDNNQTGIVNISGFNAKALTLIQEKNSEIYYVSMPFVGVIPTSVKLKAGILKYNYEIEPLEDCIEINNYTMEYDEYGNLNKITNLPSKIEEKDENGNIIATTPIVTLWLECEYLPYTYWINVKDYWEISLAEAEQKQEKATQALEQLNSDLNIKQDQYNNLLEQKKDNIKKFEQMMGPALREGYWQPEDYYDYNNRFYIDRSHPGSSNTNQVKYDWDNKLFDNEEEVIFKQGNKFRQYLMIDLSGINQTELDYIKENYNNLYFYYYDYRILNLNENLEATDSQYIENVRKSKHAIHLDGGCKFGFIYKDNVITPVLIITDSALFTKEQLEFFRDNTNYEYYSSLETPSYSYYNILEFPYTKYIFGQDNIDLLSITEDLKKQTANLRITINSLSLNTSSSELMIKLGNEILKEYEDYYITKDYENVYITIKPEVLFKIGNLSPSLKMVYSLSNTETAIYLDALKVAKENAYPKVSYEVDLSIYQPKIIQNIYKKLSHIVHINDTDLKFKEVQGYISRIELDLDHPWLDKIEIKNYKTKFEDLFSTIIASTESMKKNEHRYNIAANNFNLDGSLKSETIINALNNNSNAFNEYLNSNFDSFYIINNKLESLFNEAGALLSTAGNSLVDMQSLSSSNASILSGLYAGVQNGFGNGIDYTVLVGDNVSVSAVRINKDEGIFIGSNKKIVLSSTNAIKDSEGNYIGKDNTVYGGADVELSPQRLLMGVSNLDTRDTGVVDITSDQILLAVGTAAQQLETNNKNITEVPDDQEISGVQIKKDYIGLATGNQINRSIVSIKPTDITLGLATESKQGSYIKLSKDKLEFGSKADLYINTNNFKLQTNVDSNNYIGNTIFAIGTNLQNINKDTNITALGHDSTVNFLINQSGAYINGIVYATAGRFTGDIVASSFQLNGNTAVNDFNQAISNSSLATQVSNITSITAITPLYYLTNSNNVQKPQNKITNNNNALNVWTMTIPTYQEGYNYYRCTQYEWSNNSVTWSDVYKDLGLTTMYKYATDASIDAANAAMAVDPISIYGLVGYNSSAAGEIIGGISYDSNGYPTWNNKSYGLILGNEATLPMLIGSNSGITIAGDTASNNGEAVVMNNGGISLHGATINLTSATDKTTNVISLGEDGINLTSSRGINMLTGDGDFKVIAANGSLVFYNGEEETDDIQINSNRGEIRCKKIICDTIEINGKIVSINSSGEAETSTASHRMYFDGSATRPRFIDNNDPNLSTLSLGRGSYTTITLTPSEAEQFKKGKKIRITLNFNFFDYVNFHAQYISMRVSNDPLVTILSAAPIDITLTKNQSTYVCEADLPDDIFNTGNNSIYKKQLLIYLITADNNGTNSVGYELPGYFYPAQSYIEILE